MGSAQPQSVEDDIDARLPNNPFVPPKGDVCFINDLPPELLSRIFEVGTVDDDSDSEDEDEEDEDDGGSFSSSHRVDDSGCQDSDVEMEDSEDEEETDEEEMDEEEDEDEDEDEGSEATECSCSSPPRPLFQIIVSHVCRHWRHIALSTPSLWTTVEVTPEARPPYQFASMVLERSKGLPIDVYVDCEPADHECGIMDCDGATDGELAHLYDLLSPHIHRWRTIEISVSEYDQIRAFLDPFSNFSTPSAPQLTTLQLYHHGDTDVVGNLEDDFLYPVLFGGSAPCLTSLVLWGVYVNWGQPWLTSASKLVDLELAFHVEDGRPTWAQLATILRGATSLEKLSLRQSGPSGDPPEWFIEPTPASPGDLNAPILLPKVTNLTLAFHPQTHAIGLLKKLVFPALNHLVLDFDNGDFTDFVHMLARPATSVSSPLARERPPSLLNPLRSLKLAGLPCNEECVEELYEELQNLTSLNLSLSYLRRRFLDVLSSSSSSGGRTNLFLPSLKTLYVSGTCGKALREVVEGRRLAGVPLQTLYVEESCDLDSEDMEWLRQNMKTFELFEGSDDEDMVDFEDLPEEEDADAWSDID